MNLYDEDGNRIYLFVMQDTQHNQDLDIVVYSYKDVTHEDLDEADAELEKIQLEYNIKLDNIKRTLKMPPYSDEEAKKRPPLERLQEFMDAKRVIPKPPRRFHFLCDRLNLKLMDLCGL